MRYLTSALVSEGATDDRFLPRLLGRALAEMCMTEFDESVDVADVQPMRVRRSPAPVDEILTLLDANVGSYSLVFFHHDQGANPARVETEWLRPLREKWGQRRERLVAVVPIRETEAWLLADGDALRSALGVRWTDAQMGLPSQAAHVEQVTDPKKALGDIMGRVSRSVADHFGQLGELVSLPRLAAVPAYQKWWHDTSAVLEELGYRRC